MRSTLLILLLLPQLAAGRVYMCVDEETGRTSFTDKACESAAAREEVRVDPVNLDSGGRGSARAADRKTWNSERDQRKTGLEYNASRRELYESRATVQSQ